MAEVIFINQKGVQSFDGQKVTRLSRPVKMDTHVYFPMWVWKEVCKRYPDKYKMNKPTYQGLAVVLT